MRAESDCTIQQLLAGAGRLLNLSRVVLLESGGSGGRRNSRFQRVVRQRRPYQGQPAKKYALEWGKRGLCPISAAALVVHGRRMLALPESIRVIYVRFSTRAQIQYLIGNPQTPLGLLF
jgi:hypothetical protein